MSQSQKEAAEYAEVLLAYSRGEEIQMRERVNEEWKAPTYPLWDFGRFEYRVAPKPVEGWMWLSNQTTTVGYDSKEQCEDNNALLIGRGRPVFMREVTE